MYQYTVQAGDTANGIAQAHGFSNYQSAGISTPKSGNYNQISPGEVLTLSNYKAGQASPIASTPPVISSNDVSGQFNSNTNALAGKVPPPVVPGTGTGAGGTGSPTPTPDAPLPAVPVDAAAQAKLDAAKAAGTVPSTTTGNPILDSLQLDADAKEAQNESDAAAQKQQVQTMLQTNLANTDAAFAAQISSIQSTYTGLIDTQTRINNLDVSRTKAYGLGTGNAISAPLEFTNAVSNKETDAAAAIAKLDNARDSAIAQAQAAEASGDATLMQDSMDQIDKIESDMKTTATQIQDEVTSRASLLTQVETQQKQAQQTQAAQLLAAATLQYSSDFIGANGDATKQDTIVKNIVAGSGGLITYSQALGSLSTAATTAATNKTQAAKDASTLALQAAQTTSAQSTAAKNFADAQKTQNTPTPSQTYDKINQLLAPGVTDKNGVPYLDANGKLTKQGFQTVVNAAATENMTRADFLKQYGSYLDPNGYSNYGMTQAEIDGLNDTSKTNPTAAAAATAIAAAANK